jgi:hypothetical protein
MMKGCLLTGILHPCFTIAFYLYNPFLLSNFLPVSLGLDPGTNSGWVFGLLLGIPIFYLMLLCWAINGFFIAAIVIIVYTSLFLLNEIK